MPAPGHDDVHREAEGAPLSRALKTDGANPMQEHARAAARKERCARFEDKRRNEGNTILSTPRNAKDPAEEEREDRAARRHAQLTAAVEAIRADVQAEIDREAQSRSTGSAQPLARGLDAPEEEIDMSRLVAGRQPAEHMRACCSLPFVYGMAKAGGREYPVYACFSYSSQSDRDGYVKLYLHAVHVLVPSDASLSRFTMRSFRVPAKPMKADFSDVAAASGADGYFTALEDVERDFDAGRMRDAFSAASPSLLAVLYDYVVSPQALGRVLPEGGKVRRT